MCIRDSLQHGDNAAAGRARCGAGGRQGMARGRARTGRREEPDRAPLSGALLAHDTSAGGHLTGTARRAAWEAAPAGRLRAHRPACLYQVTNLPHRHRQGGQIGLTARDDPVERSKASIRHVADSRQPALYLLRAGHVRRAESQHLCADPRPRRVHILSDSCAGERLPPVVARQCNDPRQQPVEGQGLAQGCLLYTSRCV